MTNKKFYLILLFVTLLAFIVRIIFPSHPPLLWDEAALGYNAYSILHTAKDEYGKLFPLIFKSFGDYKPGFYVYLTVPFVAVFGLNPFSVRLPSIILGSLLPFILALLINQLSPKNKGLSLLSALVLAFNPFNIHFSRGAWETNILTFELLLASYFFFKSISSKFNILNSKFLLLSVLTFGAAFYTYQAAKLMVPFILFSLLITNYSLLITNYKKILTYFIFPLFIISLPILYGIFFSSDSNRLKVVSLTSYPRPHAEQSQIISESNQSDYSMFHNQAIFFLRNFTSRYFNHFSPRFLTFEGDWQNPRHSAIYTGVLLFPGIIFLVIGLFSIPNTKYRILNTFFFLWLFLAPIPAALTRDSVQSTRAMSLSIPLVYFISLGIYSFIHTLNNWFKKFKFLSVTSYLLLFTIYVLSFYYYSDLYHNHTIIRSPHDYLYGYTKAMDYLISNQNNYKNLYFTDFYGQPYIYYLFQSQYPPQKYQSQALLTENAYGDTGKVENIDNVIFHSVPFELAKSTPSTLVIYSNDEILRQGIHLTPDFSKLIPLSPIGQISTFYAFINP